MKPPSVSTAGDLAPGVEPVHEPSIPSGSVPRGGVPRAATFVATSRAFVAVAAIALVLAAPAVVFMLDGPANVRVFTAIQAATVAFPDPFWSCVTVCGTGLVAFALLSPTLVTHPRYFAAGLAAAAFAGAYANGMKRLFGLPRPAVVLDGHLHTIGHALRANTFPSGHSVTAFTLAALLIFASTRPTRTACWMLPAAAAIALSRIAVGAHWPADLAAGAVGGWLCGALGVALVVRWRTWNSETGVRVMAIAAVGIGVALFVVDLGYPQAVALQYAAGLLSIGSGLVALRRPRVDDHER